MIPIPELHQVLILMLTYPQKPGGALWDRDQEESDRLETAITVLTGLPEMAFYIFYDPPDASDEAEDWLGQWTDRIALAPQAFGSAGERVSGAFRRIFSRAVTQKAVMGDLNERGMNDEQVTAVFKELDLFDVVAWITKAGRVPLMGIKQYFPDFRIDLGQRDAADLLREFCGSKGLKLRELEAAGA